MTGLEKNADIVKLASYAPLFAKLGENQWSPNLIWFDREGVYCSPDYYVQSMFTNNIGSHNIGSEMSGQELGADETEAIYSSASFDRESGDIIVKLVNTSSEEKVIDINVLGADIAPRADEYLLFGKDKSERNSRRNPKNVSEIKRVFEGADKSFAYKMKPYSFVVLRLHS